MGPYARGGPSLLKDERTAGGRTLEEDEEEEDSLREGAADGRQMQGLLQSDHTGWRLGWTCTCSLLNGNFSQLPAVTLLTRSQNTQTNRNMRQMLSHTFLHTRTHWRCQNRIISVSFQILKTILNLNWLNDSTCGETNWFTQREVGVFSLKVSLAYRSTDLKDVINSLSSLFFPWWFFKRS